MSAVQEVLASGIVDAGDLARVVGTSSRTILRWHAEDHAPRRDSEDRLLELRAVVLLAARVMPEAQARLWIRSPIRELDWRRPLDVVAEGDFRAVIDVLTSLAEGVTA